MVQAPHLPGRQDRVRRPGEIAIAISFHSANMNATASRIARRLAGVALLVLTPVPAQNPTATAAADDFVVVPEESPDTTKLPWRILNGSWGSIFVPYTTQIVLDLPEVPAAPIRSVSLRRADPAGAQPGTLPAFDVNVDLWMGHSPLAPADIQFRHAASRGPDFSQVTVGRSVRFPPVPWMASGQYPFSHRIPLDFPFQFTQATSGVIELRFNSSTLDYQTLGPDLGYFDARFCARVVQLGASGGAGVLSSFGLSCGPSAPGIENRLIHSSWPSIGNANRVMLTGHLMYGGGPREVVHFFGGLSDRTWNGLALPYALDGLGAPGCTAYCSWEFEFPSVRIPLVPPAAADLTMPNDVRLLGMTMFLQAVRANPILTGGLQIYTSDAMRMRFIPKLQTNISYTTRHPSGSVYGPEYVDNYALGGPVMLLDAR